MKKILTGLFIFLLIATAIFAQKAVVQCHTPKVPKLSAIAECLQGPGGDKVTLTWTQENRSEVSWFEIEKFSKGLWSVLATPGKSADIYVDQDVQEGETYYYRIRAVIKWSNTDIRKSAWSTAEATVPVCKLPPPERRDCYFELMKTRHGVAKIKEDPNWNDEFKFIRESQTYFGHYENGRSTDFELMYFRGYSILYMDEETLKWRYRVDLEWGIKVRVGSNKYEVIDYTYTDYRIVTNKHESYVLVFNCGPCDEWRYFGPVQLQIPIIKN